MNFLDRAIAFASPKAAVERARYRRVLSYYEAATGSRLRKGRTAPGAANVSVERGGRSLREQARYYEQNHDLARGVLDDLVLKTIGPTGISCEPQPRTKDGEIHDDLAAEIAELHKDWAKRPEVTWQHDWASSQRLLCRSWMRDGEAFVQELLGTVAFLDHGTTVPYSLEMIEADLCPLEHTAGEVMQGVELNVWGRPRAYWFYLEPPSTSIAARMKRVPADRVLHVKHVDRIRQIRGVSKFAAVLTRFDDLKDYEESERIAAKVAASMAAFIRKGAPEDYAAPEQGEERELKFAPGMIFDDLMPGEEIGTIDTKRPNPNLLTYRQGQMRAIASGAGTAFSSIAKDYNGTYSAQRQELVESWSAYATLAAEFTAAIVRPVYESFIVAAIASGKLKVPPEVIPESVDDAIYIAPQMPWIDPDSEADASIKLEGALFASGPEIIRRRGQSPRDVLAQAAAWQRAKEKALPKREEPQPQQQQPPMRANQK